MSTRAFDPKPEGDQKPKPEGDQKPEPEGDPKPEPEHEPEWYAKGLRFTCSQCGNCCTGPPGAVWFTPEEGTAMAKHLGMNERAFYRTYARRANGRFSLTEAKTEYGYDCIFLERNSRSGTADCALYGARPSQCRTWPFWPDQLKSPEAWRQAKLETPCPGMDTGRLIRIDQIRIQRDEAARSE